MVSMTSVDFPTGNHFFCMGGVRNLQGASGYPQGIAKVPMVPARYRQDATQCSYKLTRPISTGWVTQVQANSYTRRLAQSSRRAHQQA